MLNPSLAVVALGAVCSLGCGSEPPTPVMSPQGGTETSTATASTKPAGTKPSRDDDTADDPSRARVNISDEIRKACGLTDADAFFDFDSAKVRDSETGVLVKLATCFSTGALKGRVMLLVGHADSRGDSEYNMVLGGRRAESVKSYLSSKGLAADKVTTNSRGAMDASGNDEAGYARDRRVDVALAP